jgi:glycosyltransferase involved in cell wall biosynthesis
MTKILYLSATSNSHDQNLLKVLSNEFQVTTLTEIKSGEQLPLSVNHFELVVYTPLNLAVPWDSLNYDHAYGLCMAFEINELIETEIEVISRNVRFSDAVNIDNSYVSEKFHELFGDRISVTNFKYGCDVEIFHSRLDPAENTYNRIVCNRSWKEVHQNVILVEALDLLNKHDIDFQCSFIGAPPANLNIDSKYPNLYSSGKIKFLAKLTPEEMAVLLKDSDIYVSASRSDGTSVSLLEAMVSGKIVVTTDFPANLELISHNENGFTFRNGDSVALFQTIRKILNQDNTALYKIREKAQKTALDLGDWSVESKILRDSLYNLMKKKDINE